MVSLGSQKKVAGLSEKDCKMIRKNWWIFPSIFISCLIIFDQSLSYYFFQDDWFVLDWVRTGNLLSLFSFRTDIIYWRPLSMPIFFALSKSLFGLNPLGYHLIAFIFHLVNIILVYFLMRQLKLKKTLAYFAAFIWGTAAFHFVPLSWLSTTSYILGPTFILSSIIFFLKSRFKFSFLFFILGLLSSELSLTTIPLIIILDDKIKGKIKNLIPFLIAVAPYLIARFIIFPLPANNDYAPIINSKILVSLFWYFAWTFNVAERFSTIFYLSTIKTAVGPFVDFFKLLIGPIFLMITFVVLITISKIKMKIIVRSAIWFLVGLLPVILLPKHTYAMYLTIASIGIIYGLSEALEKIKRFQLEIIAIIVVVWFTSSLSTVNFLRTNHWVANEQAASKAYTAEITAKVKNPPQGSIFVIRNPVGDFASKNGLTIFGSENTLYQSLNDSSAIQVLYNDPSLKSIFPTSQQKAETNTNQRVFEIEPK